MAKVKNIKGGHLDTLAQETIVSNDMYAVDDFPQGGITNAQMTSALTQIGWYKDGDVFLCLDDGTYSQNKFYEYKVTNGTASWVEHQTGGIPVLTGTTAPTTSTIGQVGQFYIETTTPTLYYCSAVTAQGTSPETYVYTWSQTGGADTDLRNNTVQIVGGDGKFSAGGATSNSGQFGVAIGYLANNSGQWGVSIGVQSEVNYNPSVAIGYKAKSRANKAIQIGEGTNTSSNTLQIFNKNIYNHDTDTLKVANLTDGTTTKTMTEVLEGGEGIPTLEGLVDDPINMAEDMEEATLYYLTGYLLATSSYNVELPQCLGKKTSATEVLLYNVEYNAVQQTFTSATDKNTIFTIDSDGYIVDYSIQSIGGAVEIEGEW